MSPTTTRVNIGDYIRWLEIQLRDEDSGGRSYLDLANAMFAKEFAAIMPMDANRMVDGLDLRVEYAHLEHMNPNRMKFLGPCSFLEVLVGLSRRLAFNAGGQAPGWAWQLLCNLELDRMSDPLTTPRLQRAEAIMDNVIRRTYSPDGTGGFFPLNDPDDDMTRIELWYQMHAYISELHPEH
jgi:hypothetical protein